MNKPFFLGFGADLCCSYNKLVVGCLVKLFQGPKHCFRSLEWTTRKSSLVGEGNTNIGAGI